MTIGRKCAALILTAFLVLSAGGCGGSIDVSKFTENTLVIHKDGSVAEVSVDSFGEAYYTQEALEQYVNEEVDAYNKQHPAASGKENDKAITVDTVKVSDGNARVVLTYENAQVYMDFNNASLDLVDASRLSEEAKALGFKDAKGQSVGSWSAIEKPEDYQAVVVYAPVQVAVSGKIAYVSDHVTVTDKSTAKCDGAPAVIVYK